MKMKKSVWLLVVGLLVLAGIFTVQAGFRENILNFLFNNEDIGDGNTDKALIIEEPKINKNAELVFVSPENGEEDIAGKSPVTFMFADSIFALENPESVQNWLQSKIKITPEIEGNWQLLGTTGMLFEPKSEWVNSTEYKIVIPDEIVEGGIEHGFQTPIITLRNTQARDLINKNPLILNFSQKVDLAEVRKISFSPAIEFLMLNMWWQRMGKR